MLKLPSSIVSSTRQVAAVLKTFSATPSASGLFAALVSATRDSGPSTADASPVLAGSAPTASQEAIAKGPVDWGPVVGAKSTAGVPNAGPVGANQPSFDDVKPSVGATLAFITARARFPVLPGQKADPVDVQLSGHLDYSERKIRKTRDGDVTLQPALSLPVPSPLPVQASGATCDARTPDKLSPPGSGLPTRTGISGREYFAAKGTVVLVRAAALVTPAPVSSTLGNVTLGPVMHSGLETSIGTGFIGHPEIKVRVSAPGSVALNLPSPVIAAVESLKVAPAPVTSVTAPVTPDATPVTVISGIGVPVAAMVPSSRFGFVAADTSLMLAKPASPAVQEPKAKGLIDQGQPVITKSIVGVRGATQVGAPKLAMDGVRSHSGRTLGFTAARARFPVLPEPQTASVGDQPLGRLDRRPVATPMPVPSPLVIVTPLGLVSSESGAFVGDDFDGVPEAKSRVGAPGSMALNVSAPLVEPSSVIAADRSSLVAPAPVTLISGAVSIVAIRDMIVPSNGTSIAAMLPGSRSRVALDTQSMMTAINPASAVAPSPGETDLLVGIPPSVSIEAVRTKDAKTTLGSLAPTVFPIGSMRAANSVGFALDPGPILGGPDITITGSLTGTIPSSSTDLTNVAFQIPGTRLGPIDDTQNGSVRAKSGQSNQVEASSQAEANFQGGDQQHGNGLSPFGTPSSMDVAAPGRPFAAHAGLPPAWAEQMVEAVSAMAQSRSLKGRMSVSVAPAELGRINITVEREANGMTVIHVQAERLATLDMLRTDQADLVRALDQSGHDRNGHSLSFSWDGDGGASGWNHPTWGSQSGQSSGYFNPDSGQIASPEALPSLAFQAAARGGVDVTA